MRRDPDGLNYFAQIIFFIGVIPARVVKIQAEWVGVRALAGVRFVGGQRAGLVCARGNASHISDAPGVVEGGGGDEAVVGHGFVGRTEVIGESQIRPLHCYRSHPFRMKFPGIEAAIWF